ncbi:hypothetical protein V0288_18715 [Pannus brasiliensis CCIBt3594]|uniref:Uncharacterized protein n=1 Tax=Pannus brasiliensis CCIBt3594 TaxID=1427578 RepID=A0AAW9QVS6_9CHRO
MPASRRMGFIVISRSLALLNLCGSNSSPNFSNSLLYFGQLILMKEFHISKTISDCLIINEKCLVLVFELIKQNYEEITIKAECSNGLTIETDDINDIINHDNTNQYKIIIIIIQALKKEKSPIKTTENLKITIGSEQTSLLFLDFNQKTASLDLESISEKNILYISRKLEEYLLDCRPWYNYLAKTNFSNFISYIFPVFIFFITVVVLFFKNSYIYNILFNILLANIVTLLGINFLNFINFIFYGLIICICPPFSILKKSRKFNHYLFPKIYFLIGNQKEQYKKIEARRNQFLQILAISIVLSFILGLLVNYISAKWF